VAWNDEPLLPLLVNLTSRTKFSSLGICQDEQAAHFDLEALKDIEIAYWIIVCESKNEQI